MSNEELSVHLSGTAIAHKTSEATGRIAAHRQNGIWKGKLLNEAGRVKLLDSVH